MTNFSNPQYLRQIQYKNPQNLNARVALHRRFSTNRYPWMQWVFDQLDVPLDAKIFEIGCGPAYLWSENVARIPASWSLHLSDLSFGMLTTAKSALPTGGFRFLSANAQQLPVGAHTYDVVLANHMLYHVPDPRHALAEARRILKPGGMFYATTNGFRHLIEIWEWVAAALPGRSDILSSRQSILNFSLQNGKALLSLYFSSVGLVQFPDSLEITEVQPLIDFIVSSSMQLELNEAELSTCREFLERKLASEGVLRVTKGMGLFVAESTR